MHMIHGSRHTYRYYHCHCDECKKANAEYQRKWKARQTEYAVDNIPHGQGGYTNYGCKCEVCTKANTEASVEYRRRRKKEGGNRK